MELIMNLEVDENGEMGITEKDLKWLKYELIKHGIKIIIEKEKTGRTITKKMNVKEILIKIIKDVEEYKAQLVEKTEIIN